MKQFDGQKINIPKAMVTSVYGHEDMIDYMSTYRTQDKMGGKHYLPEGGLFWFSCNEYGDFTGHVIFIKNVPDEKLLEQSYLGKGYRKRKPKKKPKFKQLFTDDITVAKRNTVKPILYNGKD